MSDLAPFVAAQLRDKVVSDLQEENRNLRNQLDNAYKVEITGKGGQPVFATGSFQDGCRRETQVCYWDVDCEMMRANLPVSIFQEDVEIRLGGIEFASSASGRSNGQMSGHEWDDDDRKEILCSFIDSSRKCLVHIRIDGWPKSDWLNVQERDFQTRMDGGGQFDVFEVLKNEVSVLFPEATVTFYKMAFHTDCVGSILDNLGVPPVNEEEVQEQRRLAKKFTFIARHLRNAGNVEFGHAFAAKLKDLNLALTMLQLDEPNEEMHYALVVLVQMQMEVEDSEAFLLGVLSRYDLAGEANKQYVLDYLEQEGRRAE